MNLMNRMNKFPAINGGNSWVKWGAVFATLLAYWMFAISAFA